MGVLLGIVIGVVGTVGAGAVWLVRKLNNRR